MIRFYRSITHLISLLTVVTLGHKQNTFVLTLLEEERRRALIGSLSLLPLELQLSLSLLLAALPRSLLVVLRTHAHNYSVCTHRRAFTVKVQQEASLPDTELSLVGSKRLWSVPAFFLTTNKKKKGVSDHQQQN